MPFLELPRTALYYDIFLPDITQETGKRTLLLVRKNILAL
jgi:hypothetical protein